MNFRGVDMRPLESHATEEASSAGNMQMNGPKLKRKRSDSSNCHQCHRNDKEEVVRCTKCKQKNYCITCISKWYTGMQKTDFVEACAICRNICNCTACLQSDVNNKELLIPDLELRVRDKIQYSKYIVRVLLPTLKQFVVEQNLEKEEEARTQGLLVAGLQLPKANFNHDDKVKCNNCKASIYDIHRSCASCLYKLCITCCQEIRNGFPWGKLTDKGTVVCPPEGTGGCGLGNLELRSTYPDNWLAELLARAESIAEVGELIDAHKASEGACSCSRYNQEIRLDSAESSKEAAPGEVNASYFQCPTVVAVEASDQKHFQCHLHKGEPVIVPDLLSRATGLSWEPLVMWRACRKSRRTSNLRILDFTVLNCINRCEERINMHQFFEGYSEGLFDNEGRMKILRLECWPPAESFQDRMPRHFREFVRCLPFKHYTYPRCGFLNVSAKTPKMSLKPDLGPKLCFSYGVGEELGFDSVTKLQYALSDRVDVLMHTAAICVNPQGLSRIEEPRKENFAQDPVVSSVRNEKANEEVNKNQQCEMENKNKGKEKLDPSTSRNRERRSEGGAIWDIFRRQDVPKLEEYLQKHSGEFRDIFPLQQLAHPIHEKAFYLTMEHKRILKEEYGIEPWTFAQRLGEAVFVPAGCPYQVRNVKSCTSVSVNFVSPESVGECIRLSMEYRRLPQNHSSKEDKLQVNKMALNAISQAVEFLESVAVNNTSTNPTAPASVPGERLSIDDMRRNLECMKLVLETKGHLIDRYKRAYLLREIPILIQKINSIAGPSSS